MNKILRPITLAILMLSVAALAACGDRPDGKSSPTVQAGSAEHGPDHSDDHRSAAAGTTATTASNAAQADAEADAAARTTIAPAMALASGIRVAAAGPGRIVTQLEVQGLLAPIDGSIAQANARFPGQVRTLRYNVGDRVGAGQTVATIESNLSLTTYAVAAPIAGQVMSRQAQLGSGVAEGQLLYEIADLSRVWVDLHAFGGDVRHLKPGAQVEVTRLYDGASTQVVLERILPGTVTASQSAVARATLANHDELWRPGTAVSARITVDDRQVALALPHSALQTMGSRDVVFVRDGDVYRARPVRLGERDGDNVEILDGLRKGEQVVVEQSFLVKADIEKAGATHAH